MKMRYSPTTLQGDLFFKVEICLEKVQLYVNVAIILVWYTQLTNPPY